MRRVQEVQELLSGAMEDMRVAAHDTTVTMTTRQPDEYPGVSLLGPDRAEGQALWGSLSSRKRRAVALLQATALTLLLGGFGFLVSAMSQHPAAADFAKLYASARFFWEGQSIYSPVPVEAFGPLPDGVQTSLETLHPNLNLPAVTLLFAPLAMCEYRTAYAVWSAFSLLCGFAAVVVLAFSSDGAPNRIRLVFSLADVLLAYFPTFATVMLGQTSLVLLLLLATVWAAARNHRDVAAGLFLGFAVTMKIFVGLLLVFFVVRRRWRLVFWCIATLLFGTVAGLLAFGPGAYWDFVRTAGSVTWYSDSWNASLLGLFTRVLGGAENTPIVNMPWLAHSLSWGLSLLGVLALVRLSWPKKGEPSLATFDLTFGLALALSLLISPLGWMYYFPILLIAVVPAWCASYRLASARSRLALLLAWLLSTVPFRLLKSEELNVPLQWFTLAGVYLYGLVILTVTLGMMTYRLKKATPTTVSTGLASQPSRLQLSHKPKLAHNTLSPDGRCEP